MPEVTSSPSRQEVVACNDTLGDTHLRIGSVTVKNFCTVVPVTNNKLDANVPSNVARPLSRPILSAFTELASGISTV